MNINMFIAFSVINRRNIVVLLVPYRMPKSFNVREKIAFTCRMVYV